MFVSLFPPKMKSGIFFTLLLELTRIIFLDSISEFQIEMLEQLIEEFFIGYKEHFFQSYQRNHVNFAKKCRIIPKMHHLVHYPRFIRLLGPLKSFSCMRFKAEHSYFKLLQRHIHNFINPPKTLAIRHQQWQCNEFRAAGDSFVKVKVTRSPFSVGLLQNYVCSGQIAELLNIDTTSNVMIQMLKWVGCNKSIKKESLILCPLSDSTRKAFGLISSILSYGEKIIFLYQMYRSLSFNSHFQAFRIVKRNPLFHLAILSIDLPDMCVFQSHSPGFVRTNNL